MGPKPRREPIEEQWERIESRVFAGEKRTSRPTKDERTVINRMLWLYNTGSPVWGLGIRISI